MLENKDLAAMRALMKGAGGGTGGGTSIDVTAQVGQTIVVKEVDANGKPTAWESADYQPRTHWEEEKAIITDAPIIRNEEIDMVGFNADVEFVPGYYYTATYNGEKHTALCRRYTFEGETVVFVGNGVVYGLEDTGESFFMTYFPDDGFVVFFTVDAMNGEAEMPTSVSVAKKTFVPIPEKYLSNAMPYYIDVTGEGTTEAPYVCAETWEDIMDMFNSGREIKVRTKSITNNENFIDETYNIYGLCDYEKKIDTNTGATAFLFCFICPGKGTTSNAYLFFIPNEDGTYTITRSF